MRLIFRFVALLILFFPFYLSAQEKSSPKVPRVLILLDGSSSMSEGWGEGRTRFQQAGKFILSLIDSLGKANEEVEFGLRVFGHQYPAQQKNCYDTKLEIKFSRYNTVQMEARLAALHGYGVSPIAYSLSEAAMEDFENESKYAYSIVLVTDGGESCDGDICKVVNDLLQRKIFFRPYIVSLVDYEPLKDLYRCLGTFLTVSKEPEMPLTISKIVTAHREGFVRAKTGAVIRVIPEEKKSDTIIIPITIKEPVKKIEQTVKHDPLTTPIKIKEEPSKTTITEPVKQVIPVPQRDKRVIKPLRFSKRLKTFMEIPDLSPDPVYIAVPPFRLADISPVPKKETIPAAVIPSVTERSKLPAINYLALAKRKPLRRLLKVIAAPKQVIVPPFVVAQIAPPEIPPTVVKPLVTVKETPKPVVTKPVIKSTDQQATPKEEPPFTIEKTPAAETLVEVFFTDGKGKFYTTTPQISLNDPITNKTVRQFYRTVNPEGNPDAVKAPSGKFNLSVTGSSKTFLKAVAIEPNMNNKIFITVSNGSLQFVWKGQSNKKPVDKYKAIVKRNFVAQASVQQRCDTILPYPPGNYHIEINTMPVSVRSVDLNFGTTVLIDIEEPGTVQISNTNNMGKAIFYFQLGDKFLPFLPMNISGIPEIQKAEILPGIYEVRFVTAPGLPEKTLVFHIKSNQTTTVELQ